MFANKWLLGGWLLLLSVSLQAAQFPDFRPLVRASSPAVVNISSELAPGADTQALPDILRKFLDTPEPSNGDKQPRAKSLGSGFIISEEGYLLTNYHVIKGAEKILVRLTDRRQFEAQLIGVDKRTDLALLKLPDGRYPALKLGSSKALEAGQWVLAIGSPFGYDFTVTAGVVSATQRALEGEESVPFIQTDVAINPGNSGGPLFNLDGEVVGINAQILTRSGGFMGLSFAIPIDVAMAVVEQLKQRGFATRGWLGVELQEVNAPLAESFGLKEPGGALIVKVEPEGPGADIGLKAGDVVLRFAGELIHSSNELINMAAVEIPGSRVSLLLQRDGKPMSSTITIGSLLGDMPGAKLQQDESANSLDVVLAELTEQQLSRLGAGHGVLVKEVNQGAGDRAGLQSGDVITLLNGVAIHSIAQFVEQIRRAPRGQALPMRVVREGVPTFVALRL